MPGLGRARPRHGVQLRRWDHRVYRMGEMKRPYTCYKAEFGFCVHSGSRNETHSRVQEMRNSSVEGRATRRREETKINGIGAVCYLHPPSLRYIFPAFSLLLPFSLSFVSRVSSAVRLSFRFVSPVVFFARALLRAPSLRRSILIRARTSARVNLYENGCRTRCRRW